MEKYLKAFVPWLAGLVLCAVSGCTQLTVKRVAPESADQGIRYSLPKPFVQVTPQPDGSVTADIVFLPDSDNTYAIQADSYLAAHTLTVSAANGLLTKVSWNGDSSAVVAQGVQSAEAVAQQQQEAANKVSADKASKLSDAQKAVDDAQLAADTAQADLELLIANNASSDLVLKAKLALQEAQIKLANAKARLARLKGQPSGSSTISNGDKPAPQTDPGEKTVANQKYVFGPVLFAVNEWRENNTPMVKLQATGATPTAPKDAQPMYPTVPLPKADVKAPEFFPKGVEGVHPDKDGNMQLLIVSTGPVSSVDLKQTKLKLGGAVQSLPPISLETATTIRVDLKGCAAGDYELQLFYSYRSQDPSHDSTGEHTLNFKIQK